MKKSLFYVGLDVHKETIAIAVAPKGDRPATVVGVIPNDIHDLLRTLDGIGPVQRLRVCYEAGPTGFGLARYLTSQGICCQVVAPSLVPKKAGRRVKTDRRDAANLAHYLRSGDLKEVQVPEAQTEAMRDLERARDDAKNTERQVRQQLDKFLLRHGRKWSKITKWTAGHLTWIREQEFSQEALRRVRDDYLQTVEVAGERVARLTADIGELVEQWTLRPLVKGLQALRGVDLITATVLAAEIGDFQRFKKPTQLMAYLGLIPSEHSSGQSVKKGGITRTGNRHVRRILIESAWHYCRRPGRSLRIAARRRLVTPSVLAIARKAEQRLCRRYQRLTYAGKSPHKAVTAVARELAGFVWAIAQEKSLLAA